VVTPILQNVGHDGLLNLQHYTDITRGIPNRIRPVGDRRPSRLLRPDQVAVLRGAAGECSAGTRKSMALDLFLRLFASEVERAFVSGFGGGAKMRSKRPLGIICNADLPSRKVGVFSFKDGMEQAGISCRCQGIASSRTERKAGWLTRRPERGAGRKNNQRQGAWPAE